CWAMASSMGLAYNKQGRPQAGPMCVARRPTGQHGGTARPFASIPWGRVASPAPWSRYRKCGLLVMRMVRLCSSVGGPRDIKSPYIWSAIWLQQRRRVACTRNVSALKPFSLTRKVEVSICTNRILPILNVSLAYSWQLASPIFGLFYWVRYVCNRYGQESYI